MARDLDAQLQELNNNIQNAEQYKDNVIITTVLKYALDPNSKFLLPEGEPPTRETDIPDGMGYTNLITELRRFQIFLREDLPPVKREVLFINMLEGLSATERDILLLIKDQQLKKRYKNITKAKVKCLL